MTKEEERLKRNARGRDYYARNREKQKGIPL